MVTVFDHDHLLYEESEHRLTLASEPVQEEGWRTWLFFPSWKYVVYVPQTLIWDDGSPLTPAHGEVVLARIVSAVETLGYQGRTEVTLSDATYENSARYFKQFLAKQAQAENRPALRRAVTASPATGGRGG